MLGVGISWLTEQIFCFLFYWGVFGLALGYLGINDGVCALFLLQLIFWLTVIRIYDLTERDLLGIEMVKFGIDSLKPKFPRLVISVESSHWLARIVRFVLLEFNCTPAGVFLCLRRRDTEGLGGVKGFGFFCFIVIFKTTYWTLAHTKLLPFYEMAR